MEMFSDFSVSDFSFPFFDNIPLDQCTELLVFQVYRGHLFSAWDSDFNALNAPFAISLKFLFFWVEGSELNFDELHKKVKGVLRAHNCG